MLVGYKLIRTKDGQEIQTWGGVYGQTPVPPAVVLLPNGDQVCGAQIGDTFGEYQFVGWEKDAPPPTKEDVNLERDTRVAGGILFQDIYFQSRPEDRENVAGATTWASLALLGGAKPGDYRWHGGAEDFVWIAADNTLVKMDAPTVIEFGKALGAWKSAHIFAARVLKDLPEIPADYRDAKYWPVQKLEEVKQ